MQYKIEAACGCHTGLCRANNEDNFCFDHRILPKDNSGLKTAVQLERIFQGDEFFGVFDGMGGESYGEEASFAAASTAKDSGKLLADFIYPPKRYLTGLVRKMNTAVCGRAGALGSGRMGSTAVMLYLSGAFAYVCNVGDSRAFRLRQGAFRQLSEDHTDEKFLAGQGIRGRRPRLTQHLGIWPEEMILEPHVAKEELMGGDQYLLCSDGLTDMVSNAEICALMRETKEAGRCVNALIARALENGGRDNVTVIVVRIREVQKT
ncbi:MAG: serine/threonine-protein phosphatase [Lachnospiraceae bacterium]|jgi:serine/threonine protein phosphatase PrpC|nr:serine/threonine-protein phosphatase [Lachnospiraceae bacterium]